MKVVFVIVVDQKVKLLYELIAVAMAIKHLSPNVEIFIISDRKTSSLSLFQDAVRHLDAKPRIVDLGCFQDHAAVVRSRVLKSQMRALVEGDFLYIDSDALPLVDLRQVSVAKSIAAAPDASQVNTKSFTPDWVVREYCAVGWRSEPGIYLNSGVIAWKDDQKGREMGRYWHEHWLELYLKRNIYKDQLSFNYMINHFRDSTEVLDQKWNGLVTADARFSSQSLVYHYFTSGSRKFPHLLDRLAQTLSETGEFDVALFDKYRHLRDPWAGRPKGLREALATKRWGNVLYFCFRGLILRKPIPVYILERPQE